MFLPVDGRIWIGSPIRKAQKLTCPKGSDPEHWKKEEKMAGRLLLQKLECCGPKVHVIIML
jgi:hypothetical protein